MLLDCLVANAKRHLQRNVWICTHRFPGLGSATRERRLKWHSDQSSWVNCLNSWWNGWSIYPRWQIWCVLGCGRNWQFSWKSNPVTADGNWHQSSVFSCCLREVCNELAATAIGIKRLQCGLHHVISDGLQKVKKDRDSLLQRDTFELKFRM